MATKIPRIVVHYGDKTLNIERERFRQIRSYEPLELKQLSYATIGQTQEGKNMMELVYSELWTPNATWPELTRVGKFIRDAGSFLGINLEKLVDVSAGITLNSRTNQSSSVIRLISLEVDFGAHSGSS